MNAEAINQAMAELDGWIWVSARSGCRFMSMDANDVMSHGPCSDANLICFDWAFRGVPNYTEDLNAVARVVGKIGSNNSGAAQKELRKIVLGRDDTRHLGELSWIGEAKVCNAAALQRCEAILRACRKWVES